MKKKKFEGCDCLYCREAFDLLKKESVTTLPQYVVPELGNALSKYISPPLEATKKP